MNRSPDRRVQARASVVQLPFSGRVQGLPAQEVQEQGLPEKDVVAELARPVQSLFTEGEPHLGLAGEVTDGTQHPKRTGQERVRRRAGGRSRPHALRYAAAFSGPTRS